MLFKILNLIKELIIITIIYTGVLLLAMKFKLIEDHDIVYMVVGYIIGWLVVKISVIIKEKRK